MKMNLYLCDKIMARAGNARLHLTTLVTTNCQFWWYRASPRFGKGNRSGGRRADRSTEFAGFMHAL
jgi:hypothetical protein